VTVAPRALVASAVIGVGTVTATVRVEGTTVSSIEIVTRGGKVVTSGKPAGGVWTAALTGVTIAASMRIVGILLIAALMVLPVIAASRIAWSMRSTILLGMAIGLGSVLAGITIAYYADLPPGGTTVLVAAATVLLAESWSAVRG